MILSVALNDARRLPLGSVQVQLDWTRREWSVTADQRAWGRVGLSTRGQFEPKSWGVLWIWDQPAGKSKRNTMIVWNAPTGPVDLVHRTGDGVLFDPKDAALKDVKFNWKLEQKAAAASGLSPLRQKALDIISANLPAFPQLDEPPNCLESEPKVKTAGGATGCGGFPGWLIKQLGAGQFAPDKVKLTWQESAPNSDAKVTKTATIRVTDPTIAWEDLGKAIDKRRGTPNTVWNPYTPGDARRPKPGDIYTLKQPNGWFRHVGVIVDASGTNWRTADGGQGQGFAVGYRARKFTQANGEIMGEDKKPAYLKGWVDLEALVEPPAA